MREIQFKTKQQIQSIARAGAIVARCHQALQRRIKAGVTTRQIDQFIDAFLRTHGATPAQLGYKGYRYASCISVNQVACHGLPSDYVLQKGDIVTVDFVADLNGWKADAARTYAVLPVSTEVSNILMTTKAALRSGIKAAQVGADIADIGYAIEQVADRAGYLVITEYVGHGIGKNIHEAPQIVHVRTAKTGVKLREGMVITIEPLLSLGSADLYLSRDGWTATTVDHSVTAQFEHTIAITKDGPQILTILPKKKVKSSLKA